MGKSKSFTFCNAFKRMLTVVMLASVAVLSVSAQSVVEKRKQLFDDGWRFCLGDKPQASAADCDDAGWRRIDLPHDWSIEGGIDAGNPTGNDGGYFPAGTAWYRKTFVVPAEYKQSKVGVYFEGVYMNSEVFVNGISLGIRPYGYSSFYYDLTPHLKFGERNTIAVRVDNSGQKNCRWYSGSGIYRHVWLTLTHPVHIAHWGVGITTPQVSEEKALVALSARINNETDVTRQLKLVTRLTYEGKEVGREETSLSLAPDSSDEVRQAITVHRPHLWSTDTPKLYQARCTIEEDGKALDTVTESFGIRSVEFSASEGLLLNGKKMILNGGCLHHDNGCLGATAYDRAEVRKVELMKAAGFNAARTSHNPPSEAFLHACDSLGLLVIDESFDGWRDSKLKYDYSIYFDEWWQKDVETMVLRDRNHPSVFCWSIGNEVIERKKLEVVTTAKRLADCIRLLDSTRPVTSALAAWDDDWEIYDPLAAVHDIVGYNYLLHKAPADHMRVPSRVIIQTESYPRDAFKNWAMVTDNGYILGDFVWTAVDYLGEAGIGRYYYEGETEGEHYERNQYPWHGAYCGDIDLTGWRKPISHYRSMLYNNDQKLYMAVKEPSGYHGKIKETLWSVWPTWESWNWPGHEGKPIDVEIYSKYASVRLYMNDSLIGEKPTGREQEFKAVFSIPYQPGKLVAVGMENGREMERCTLATAGEPAQIRLKADRTRLKADGQDLAFVTVELLDEKGRLVPDTENRLKFSIQGAGTIVGVGNANMKDNDPYVAKERKAWKGRAMVVVKSRKNAGRIRLHVGADGLKDASLNLRAVD